MNRNDLTTILWLLVVATAIGILGGLSYIIGGENRPLGLILLGCAAATASTARWAVRMRRRERELRRGRPDKEE
jgi:hypothetical protein